MKAKYLKKHLKALIITLILGAVGYYFFLPVCNPHAGEFWVAVSVIAIVFGVLDLFFCRTGNIPENFKSGRVKPRGLLRMLFHSLGTGVPAAVILVSVLCVGIGAISSMEIFQSKNLSEMLAPEPADIAEYDVQIDDVPLMDKDTATLLSQRKMGGLTDLVSQFSVGENAQVNISGAPVRVAPLEYNGFFKWFANRKEGIAGYITIDMISQQTELVRVENGIRYSNSAYFNDNLTRRLRFAAPTKILGISAFELDEEGSPYWITPYYGMKAGWFGGKDVIGVLIMDAVTGEVEDYPVEQVPDWVDHVFPADLILEQYDYHGAYKNGYWNSVFEQIGVVQTTDGYNYIAIGTDIYVYSGVTSIADDESNIGFIFVNQRTKEAVQYTLAGAEEYSAEASAEGLVQHLNYKATFPLLVNLNGEPTYYMALKDAGGLVKMYGLVNVEKYQNVAVESTLEECISAYSELMGIADAPEDSDKYEGVEPAVLCGVVTDLRTAMIDGNTWYYLQIDNSSRYYKASVSEFEDLILTNVGDSVEISFYEGMNEFLLMQSFTLHVE